MPIYRMWRFNREGYLEAEDATYSDHEIDFLNGYVPPAMNTFVAPPEYDPQAEIPQWLGGEWRIAQLKDTLPPEPTLDELKVAKLAELAEARWQEETRGLTLPDGTVIRTDRESQALLTGAALAATIDPVTPIEWKGGNGWVTLTSAQVLEIAAMVRAHIQTAFSREKALSEQVEACEDATELEALAW